VVPCWSLAAAAAWRQNGKADAADPGSPAEGIRCIVDSSGEALQAALEPGQLELVKPNQKELSALVNRELNQPDDVRTAAQELVHSGKALRVVVSLGPQGALAVDGSGFVQVVPPPMKSQSTVGAGDSMVGAMALKLAQGASLLEMTRYGVAAGSAATINQGTRLCSLADTQKLWITFPEVKTFSLLHGGKCSRVRQTRTIDYAKKTFMITMR
jgi:fructose-1-phosphate kinase PfkB-like protein